LFSHANVPGLVQAGGIGVDIFFVLSGYLITTILLREYERDGSVSLTNFYKRRSLRLLPALLLMCILFIVYAAIFFDDLRRHLREVAETLLYVTNWSRAFNLGTSHFLGHTWSLGIEEQFYLLWPIVLLGLLRLERGYVIALYAALAIAAASAVWRFGLAWHGAGIDRLYNGFDTRCDSVLLGCALAFVASRVASLWPLGVIGLAAVIVGYHFDYYLPFATTYTLIDILAALMIAGATRPETVLSHALSFSPLVAIGKISYGLYLFHYPIFLVAHHLPGSQGPLSNAIAIAATGIIAILSYFYVERWCLQIRNIPLPYATRALACLGPISVTFGVIYIAYCLMDR